MIVEKSCSKHLNHYFTCWVRENNPDKLHSIEIRIRNIKPFHDVYWDLEEKKLLLLIEDKYFVWHETHMFYFPPDLSDMKKLENKVRNYILFS